MNVTPKTFWCEHCGRRIPFRRPATEIVEAQLEHLWAEHEIDIEEQRRPPEPAPARRAAKLRASEPLSEEEIQVMERSLW